jgi:hypothetical protein
VTEGALFPYDAGNPQAHGNGSSPGVDSLSDGEAVDIVVPARPDMLRIVRMSAGVVAARAELSYEDLDDLCLAIEELGILVMGEGAHEAARLWVRFTWDHEAITVRCSVTKALDELPTCGRSPGWRIGRARHGPARPQPGSLATTAPLARLILDALVDGYGVSEDSGHPTGWLHKRRIGAR